MIDEPGAKAHAVADNMGEPLPVVDAHLPVSGLSAHLRKAPGAVLVRDAKGGFRIITKSDLIEALSARAKDA